METTFITIHNLTPDANILFASDSITDVLGYLPDDVTGRSCFDYFHPDEVPVARYIHNNGVQLDKAAVLHYCRIQHSDGRWIGCECVFTIVYDVMVACTSIYRGDAKNERRAIEAPTIRRLFTSSPRDPRYHMLEYLSSKFKTDPQAGPREPRAALILNRFTRTLTVLYATNAVSTILGITPEEINGKSFYEFIQEDCLRAAVLCLESAKANDSIAYLRFWHRDPRSSKEDDDDQMDTTNQTSDAEEDEVVNIEIDRDADLSSVAQATHQRQDTNLGNVGQNQSSSFHSQPSRPIYHAYSRENTKSWETNPSSTFGQSPRTQSSISSNFFSSRREHQENSNLGQPVQAPLEIEAVVSCTSDGLVVILRRARPLIPDAEKHLVAHQMASGIFAAPWGVEPMRLPGYQERPHNHQPPFTSIDQPVHTPISASTSASEDFMRSIREVAVFAWSLTGINGSLASYSRGIPTGEAQPPGGLPIWDSRNCTPLCYNSNKNKAATMWDCIDEKSTKQRDLDESYEYLCFGGGHLYPATEGKNSSSYTLGGHNLGRETMHHPHNQSNYQPRSQTESQDQTNGCWRSTSTELDMSDPPTLSNPPHWKQ
ncbi:hypothetical protein B7463_g736, partial [Scytalidium lignicola]